jgi:phosphopantothenoylcysteine decarboxylase/phosphopantothenate--cysteine ligase
VTVIRPPRVLITAGPTREMIDPIRYLSNRSSGTMGYALAAEAARRGFRVTLISGPVALETPRGVRAISIVSHRDLRRSLHKEFPRHDILMMAAAVSDFTPARVPRQKIKRSGSLILKLEKTPDLLAEAVRLRTKQTVIGFCLETSDWLKRAREKCHRKGLDGIVANRKTSSHDPFGNRRVTVALIDSDGKARPLRSLTKRRLARCIWDWAVKVPKRPKKRFRNNQI